ncbi:MAG: uroporphyrinogen-III synthase, partial [Solirubrobacterales bacterium]|nr:uroporphyrinogen-III synthase [Solirubrobacterales bacterium]
SIAESLIESLRDVEVDARPVLIARAAEARDVLPGALAERGARVDVVSLYETVRDGASAEAIERAQEADYVTFTSSSTVRYFAETVGSEFPPHARIVSIGPVTSATIRELGHEVDVEATEHDPDGLLDALLADAAFHADS